MPTVRIEMFPGRSDSQKRALAERITTAFVEEVGAKLETIQIIFVDVSPNNWAVSEVLSSDRVALSANNVKDPAHR